MEGLKGLELRKGSSLYYRCCSWWSSCLICKAKTTDDVSLEGKVAVVVGASGSIGSAVLQWLVKEQKIRVMAVCSGEKAKVATDLGAEAVLDYTKGPWKDQLLETTPTVDYVFDFVGGTKVMTAAEKVLNKSGMFITMIGPSRC